MWFSTGEGQTCEESAFRTIYPSYPSSCGKRLARAPWLAHSSSWRREFAGQRPEAVAASGKSMLQAGVGPVRGWLRHDNCLQDCIAKNGGEHVNTKQPNSRWLPSCGKRFRFAGEQRILGAQKKAPAHDLQFVFQPSFANGTNRTSSG